MINSIRSNGIPVYVDYFTPAKRSHYVSNEGYEICYTFFQSAKLYKALKTDLIKKNYKYYDRFKIVSTPMLVLNPVATLGVLPNQLKNIDKYKFPNSEVYNLKGILDDPNLYTIQVKSMASPHHQFVYGKRSNSLREPELLKIYRKRVYEFVASNLDQVPLMLRGKRMHWTDLGPLPEYFIQKYKITPENFIQIKASAIAPQELKLDDELVYYNICVGQDFQKLQKIEKIINEKILKLRTNRLFWDQVVKDFAKNTNLKYQSLDDFSIRRETFKYEKELKAGLFD